TFNLQEKPPKKPPEQSRKIAPQADRLSQTKPSVFTFNQGAVGAFHLSGRQAAGRTRRGTIYF
ncbi:hypothetical protein A2U01_0023239, partial [Trifolium medium]|nr:hypothetical protein [Trifolium medium]